MKNITAMTRLVCLLVFLIFLRLSSEHELRTDFLKTYTAIETSHVTHLTTDDEGNIYVGGAGTILHFDSDLKLLSSASYNNISKEKQSNTNTTNDISLLYIIPKKHQLVVCGAYHNGLCYKHPTRNVSKFRHLDTRNIFNYIGTSNPVVVLPANNDCKRCVFVARTFTPDTVTDDLYFISTRKILKNNISIAYNTLKYGDHLHSGLLIDRKRLNSIFLQPIYAFQTRQFTYLLFLQQDPVTLELETRLGRICSNDRLYDSYVDIRLRCNRNHHLYDKVTAAFFSSGSLYTSTTSNSSQTSVICSYSIQELNQFFTQTNERCFKFAKGWQPFWMTRSSRCKFSYRNAELARNEGFCGVRPQHGISGESHLMKTSFYSTEYNITSLVAMKQNNQSVVIIGTSQGAIKKIIVEINSTIRPQEYLSLTVSGTVGVEQQMSLINDTWLYFMTANNISRLDVKSCSVHSSCESCLSSQDPLGCDWCNGQCRNQEECSRQGFVLKTCPPVIKAIYPVNGTIDGGTKLTIDGYDFGSGGALVPRVIIGGAACIIEKWSSTRICCVTSEVPSERQGFVEVICNDPTSYPQRPYFIRGSSNTDQIFHYKQQVVTSYFPPYGPRYGGTVVSIVGKNLNIGATREITIGTRRCQIISLSADEMKCKTQPLNSGVRVNNNDSRLITSHLQYYVDDEDICTDVNREFEYRPNPVVEDISPKTTFNSGGASLTVFGSNLNSVAEPYVTFLNGSIVNKRCFVKSRDQMVCKIPPRPKGSTNQMKLHFILDGGEDEWNPCKTLVYEDDPIFYEFEDANRTQVLQIDNGDALLILEGANLSSTFSTKDVIVMVGPSYCRVDSLTETQLSCKPLNIHQLNDTTFPVQISVGNLNFSPGYVKYEILEEMSLIWCLILPLPVIIIIIIIVIMVIRSKRSSLDNKDFIATEKTMMFRIPDIVITDSSEGLRQSWNSLDDLDNRSTDRFTSSTLSLFEKDNLTIDRCHLEIEEEIGKGYFGCVYKGTYLNPESDAGTTRKDVAVKTLRKRSPDERELNVFLEEALIMKDFCHENVLKLVGICLEEDLLPLVILPFMKNGDLLTYIRNRRNTPTIKDLILFAVDVAKGMEYLTRLKFVHRDLAARNCMLDANLHVKVADFGLTRDVYVQQYYSCKDDKARLPVKWMALESIQSGTFTSMSDVWSYGVLLWELMTRGVNPYPDVDAWDIQRYLMSGRRLPRPEYCPEEFYVIMERCWKTLPVCRPSFQNLVIGIPEMLSELEQREENFKLTYVNLQDNPTYHFRDEEKWQT